MPPVHDMPVADAPMLGALSRMDLETTLIARAWQDEVFRLSLLTDPKGTIERATGTRLPGDLHVSVRQETSQEWCLVIPMPPEP